MSLRVAIVLVALAFVALANAGDKKQCPPARSPVGVPPEPGAEYVGEVSMILVVTEKGKVVDVAVLCGPSRDLNKKAAAAARDWIFTPAGKDGKPVAVKIRVDSHIWQENGTTFFIQGQKLRQ